MRYIQFYIFLCIYWNTFFSESAFWNQHITKSKIYLFMFTFNKLQVPLKNSSPFSVPVTLFSGLCWKWCDTNSGAEGGVKRKRWEHIINPATYCIPASHADPHEHTGEGFSLLPSCVAWQGYACSPVAPMVWACPSASTEKEGKHSLSIEENEAVT